MGIFWIILFIVNLVCGIALVHDIKIKKMVIQTRFNVGDTVYFFHMNDIVQGKVEDIIYQNGKVAYSFQIEKKLGTNVYIVETRFETNCFESVEDIYDFYSRKFGIKTIL